MKKEKRKYIEVEKYDWWYLLAGVVGLAIFVGSFAGLYYVDVKIPEVAYLSIIAWVILVPLAMIFLKRFYVQMNLKQRGFNRK